MTRSERKTTGELIAELAATVETWQAAHDAAEDAAITQLDTAMSEVRALRSAIQARHQRYRAELTALRHKLADITSLCEAQ